MDAHAIFNLLGSIAVLTAAIAIVTNKMSQGFVKAFGDAYAGALNAEIGKG